MKAPWLSFTAVLPDQSYVRHLPKLAIGHWRSSSVLTKPMALRSRWVVERTFAWLERCRRLANDWEDIGSAESWLLIAHIRLLEIIDIGLQRNRIGAVEFLCPLTSAKPELVEVVILTWACLKNTTLLWWPLQQRAQKSKLKTPSV